MKEPVYPREVFETLGEVFTIIQSPLCVCGTFASTREKYLECDVCGREFEGVVGVYRAIREEGTFRSR